MLLLGPDSVVGRYSDSLGAGRSADSVAGRYSDSPGAGRGADPLPVWARFYAPVQIGHGAHSAFCAMVTRAFPGVKRPGRGVDHPPHLTLRLIKEKSSSFTPSLDLHNLF
jgi:hypothetical protein